MKGTANSFGMQEARRNISQQSIKFKSSSTYIWNAKSTSSKETILQKLKFIRVATNINHHFMQQIKILNHNTHTSNNSFNYKICIPNRMRRYKAIQKRYVIQRKPYITFLTINGSSARLNGSVKIVRKPCLFPYTMSVKILSPT